MDTFVKNVFLERKVSIFMSENLLQIFRNDEFGELNIIMVGSKEYFPATYCAKVLGHENPARAIRKYCKGVTEMVTPTKGGNQKVRYIPEGDLYRLIAHSKLSSAERFESWIFDEVLPTIRRTGEYKLVQKQDSYMIENPAERARRWAEEYEEKLALEQKIEKDKPLVEFAEHIQTSDDCISMNDMAKLASKNGVKIGRNRLFAFLRNQKVLKKDNIPYQRYIEAQRWFQVKESVYDTANFTRICLTTMVTPQGQRGIIKMIKKERLII